MQKQIKIGFPSLKKDIGPKIFLRRLKENIEQKKLGRICHFLNPIHDIDIFTSVARNYYGKPYVLRIDGIYLDEKDLSGGHHSRNKAIFRSIKRAAGVIFQSRFNKLFDIAK